MNEQQAPDPFAAKAKDFQAGLKKLAEDYGVCLVAGVYFKEEKQQGVVKAGIDNSLEELGLAKIVEQKFIS